MDRSIRSIEQVFALLDGMFERDGDDWSTGDGGDYWDRFYSDRSRPIPFFVAKPDESLAACLEQHPITPGRALDLGCGPGRNAVYLASRGFAVDAVDLSPVAVAWGRERTDAAGVDVRFVQGDAFA